MKARPRACNCDPVGRKGRFHGIKMAHGMGVLLSNSNTESGENQGGTAVSMMTFQRHMGMCRYAIAL